MSDGLKLIASVLENGSTMTFRMLEPEFFIDEDEVHAYEFSKGHYRRYGELPEVDTVEEETRVRFPDTPETVDYYLQNVHKRHVYNEVRAKFRPLRDAISESDIDAIREEAQSIYKSCVPYTSDTKELLTLGELAGEVLDTYDYTHELPGIAGVPTGFNYLDEETYGYQNGDLIVWPGRPGTGKCLAPDTKIVMYNGSVKEVRHIYAGEQVMGPDSNPRNVISTGFGEEEMFKVKPHRGEEWSCNKSHILHLACGKNLDKKHVKGSLHNYSITEYVELPSRVRVALKLRRVPVDFPSRETAVDPYFIGLWLGDGEKTRPVISTVDVEIVDYLRKFASDYGMRVSQYEKREGFCPRYGIVDTKGRDSPLKDHVSLDCVCEGVKRIPDEYKINSRSNRLHLLAGLLDSDGHYARDGYYEITSKYEQLGEDIAFVARSLGFGVSVHHKIVNDVTYYRLNIYGYGLHEIPCVIERKKAKERKTGINTVNSGFTIESTGVGKYCGIHLDGDHLYCLWDFTVTHNTHLLLKAARAAHDAGKSVLLVSMEMTLMQLVQRMACHEANLDPRLVRKGKLSYWGRKALKGAVDHFASANNFHLFAGNFDKKVEDVDMLVQELGPDIILVDGIYLMKPSGGRKGMGRYEAAAYVTDELKQITLMRDRPLVGTTQFGRAAGKGGEDASLENIGYTDTIGTHASIVVGIKMGKMVPKNIRRERGGVIEVVKTIDTHPYRHIEVMKNRDGESGEFGINFGFAPTNFGEIPVEEATGARRAPPPPDMGHME